MPVVLQEEFDGAFGSLHLLLELRGLLVVFFNPVAPKAVRVVIVQLVVDHFTDQLSGWLRLLCRCSTHSGRQRQNPDQDPEHTHPKPPAKGLRTTPDILRSEVSMTAKG